MIEEAESGASYSWRTDYQLLGAGIGAMLLLVAAFGDFSQGFYTFLRIYITLVAVVIAWRAHQQGKVLTAIASGVVAILFNPILPVELDRSTWQPIDLALAIWFSWLSMETLATVKERPLLRFAPVATLISVFGLVFLVVTISNAPDRPVNVELDETDDGIANASPNAFADLIPARSPEERLADAFEAATGSRTQFSETKGTDVIVTKPLQIVELPFAKALFIQKEIKDGCHACTGAIGVFYFKEEGEQTTIIGSWPEAVEGWGWGAAPRDWKLTNAFTANPAIYASGGYMGQGVLMESATITELTPAGPVTSELIGTGFSNEGAIVDDRRAACKVKGVITNIRKDRSFDVKVTGSVTSVDRYVKNNGRFVPEKKIEWGTPCFAGEAGSIPSEELTAISAE